MKVLIAAIGKAGRDSPEQALLREYAKRLPWKLEVKELEVRKPLPPDQKKRDECALLLDAAKGIEKLVALDERGELLSSEKFAATVAGWQQQGYSRMGFLIGGSDGLTDEVRQKAALVLSFGRMTWPHMMVRAMLAEQLYRASTLISGHPYHRS